MKKNILNFKYLIINILCFFNHFLEAQNKDASSNYPQQKVYIHFDKDFYVLGEIIWLKAYIMDKTPIADSLKTIVFVDIVNPEGKILNHLKLKTEKNIAQASFRIPNTWDEGTYFIKAYTPYLMPFNESAFFSKLIPIYNSNPEISLAFQNEKNQEKDKIKVELFPEGGKLLEGVETKIAFLAQNEFGEGLTVKGYLKNDKDSIISHFENLNYQQADKPQGLGIFSLKPQRNQSYQVVLEFKNNVLIHFYLPKTEEKAYALRIENSQAEILNLRIQTNDLSNMQKLKLKISQNGKTLDQQDLQLSQEQPFTNIQLAKRQLPSGLLLIQLSDLNGNLLAERIFFNPISQKTNLSISSSQNKFAQRQPMNLSINSKDTDNQSITGEFSAVVRKKNALSQTENIDSYYWLSSELLRPVESAAYYLNETNAAKEALDILLMTQKVKTYTSSPENTKIENNLRLIKGIAIDSLSQKPLTFTLLGIFVYENQKSYTAYTDKQGYFQVKIEDNIDRQTLFFFNLEKNKLLNPPVQVELLNYHPQNYQVPKKRLASNPVIQKYLLDFNKRRLIENNFADVSPKPEKVKIPELALQASQVVKLEEYVEFTDVKEFFKEVAYNVITRVKKGQTSIRLVTDKKPNFMLEYPPIYLIDGQPTSNHDLILNIPMPNIAKMEIFANYLDVLKYYGRFGAGGLIAITTKKQNINLKNAFNARQIQVFHPVQNFESINFNENNVSMPYFSPLLTWQADIHFNSNQKNEINFYNADDIGEFEVLLEGMTSEGKPLRTYFMYQVEFNK